MKNKAKAIQCPNCKKVVGHYDGKSTMNYIAKCSNCNKRVIYDVETDITITKPIIPRTSSSGVRFS